MRTSLVSILAGPAVLFALAGTVANAGPEQDLIDALAGLKNHILNAPALAGPAIAAHKATIDSNKALFGTRSAVMTAAFDLVDTYDSGIGPLWLAGSPVQSFTRSTVSDEDIAWVVFTVMQDLVDETYTAANLVTYQAVLDGRKFGSSAHFPGHVDPPAVATHTATIDASYPDTLGWLRQGDDLPARKPTGSYVAPGTIATVTVPAAIVNKGYQIRVGAHSWDFSNKPSTRRLDRVTILYDIDSTQVKVSNPLGGGIYIEVPYLANAGVVTIDITGAVRSPFFSAKSFHTTTLDEWRDTERHHPAPWADFQSGKFMTQVPTDWIYNLDDPVSLMADWDLAVDTMNDLMGFPHDRGKETMYCQVDLLLRGSAYFPGYPTGNDTYNPNTDYGGLANHHLLKGPQFAPSFVFHEQGHAYFFRKFAGETESAVNLPHVEVWNRGFGTDLDYAFAGSRGFQGNPHRTLDNTAVTWMTCFNFSPNEVPMASSEKAYQLKGHAKFVDMARLFGWQSVNDFHHQLVLENINKNTSPGPDQDELILRLARAAGVDIRPLLHFWGMHPENPAALAAAIAAETLPASARIYDLLWHYRALIPEDNAAFRTFAANWWGHQPSITGEQTEREHARQWDDADLSGGSPLLPNGEIYDGSSHTRITAVVDALLAQYFPGGDPDPDTTAPTPDPMTWASAPAAVSTSEITMTASTAEDPRGVEYFFTNLTITDGSHDSGWRDNPGYTDSGLAHSTGYTYTVKARDKSASANETDPSAPAAATTLSPPYDLGGALIYEPFYMAPGNLGGQPPPGTGLGGTWSASTTFLVGAGSLTYGTLPVSGNQVIYGDDGAASFGNAASSVGIGSSLGDAGLLADGATLWFSVVVNTPTLGGSNPDTGFAIGTDQLGSGNNLPMPTGGEGIGWTIKNDKLQATVWNPSLSRTAGPSVSRNTTILVVGEIIWGASDTINLYLPDTDLNLGPVVVTKTGAVNQASFDLITSSLKTNTGYGFDEIRFGAAYEDVIGMGGATSDYEDWAALYDPADLTDPGGDFDGDGLSNNYERIWGLDPTSGSSVNPYAVPLDPAAGSFSYTRRDPALSGLNYTVWTSPNLEPGSWTEDTGAGQLAGAPDANGVETVAVTLSASPVDGRLFAQIRAAGP